MEVLPEPGNGVSSTIGIDGVGEGVVVEVDVMIGVTIRVGAGTVVEVAVELGGA